MFRNVLLIHVLIHIPMHRKKHIMLHYTGPSEAQSDRNIRQTLVIGIVAKRDTK